MAPLTSDALDDGRLIERSRRHPEAFASLYDRHANSIYRFAARRLGTQLAEDILAETFLAAFRRRDRYDCGRANARPWLFGIAVNLIGKHRRSEVRLWRALARTGVDPIGDDGLARADERLAARGLRAELAASLATLAAPDRDVLLLVAWADLSYEEVATALAIPVGTVRSRLSRARRQLRAALGEHNPISVEALSYERP